MFNSNQPAYLDLRDIYAERTNQIVFWVGAGLSVPAKLPTWPRLRDLLLAAARAKAESLAPQDSEKALRALANLDGSKDLWLAFERLYKSMGPATFEATIRKHVTPSPSEAIPEAYRQIWKLQISGMLSLNLDQFAGRSFNLTRPGSPVNEFNGRDAGRHVHLIKTPAPFVVNLHGTHQDSTTWVLTRTDLKSLVQSPPYGTFITSVLASKTVVFLGISADDRAAGGFLEQLTVNGIQSGAHFWITDRTDIETDSWAEQNSIRVIRYKTPNGSHAELNELLRDLDNFLPRDKPAPPVTPPAATAPPLPSPEQLASSKPDQIRQLLNAHAGQILNSGSPTATDSYLQFCQKYERSIWNSWFVTNAAPDNQIFGYTLEKEVKKGAFGSVYRARSQSGEEVALKLLRPEIRNNADMLGSFRRGVRSMRILADRQVAGMVPYREAYEIPACVVMDFIHGPDLQDAVDSRNLSLEDKLKIAHALVTTIRRSHQLPERVLHRDIRPPNIMLKDFYVPDAEWEVVVLDFDLSWHRDSTEKSIEIPAATALGYLAPEQLSKLQGVSTRNALVDSFGIGMTLYFLFSERHPIPGEAAHPEWATRVHDRFRAKVSADWISLPARLARLIKRATFIEQHTRVDAATIELEVERLWACVVSAAKIRYAELWAEEFISRAFGTDYDWNADALTATHTSARMSVCTEADEVRGEVRFIVRWTSLGTEDRRTVDKYLRQRADNLTATFEANSIDKVRSSVSNGALSLTASVASSKAANLAAGVVAALVECSRQLNL